MEIRKTLQFSSVELKEMIERKFAVRILSPLREKDGMPIKDILVEIE